MDPCLTFFFFFSLLFLRFSPHFRSSCQYPPSHSRQTGDSSPNMLILRQCSKAKSQSFSRLLTFLGQLRFAVNGNHCCACDLSCSLPREMALSRGPPRFYQICSWMSRVFSMDPRLGRLCISSILEDDDVLWILDMATPDQIIPCNFAL
ncbi:uncharacterized protein BKA55DRAFT_314838 [Fusarium redolens]|uniref:Uncharacterized protein n=1 Tax=Fusarium redolens TaxID=48865 RepID=A0A9P9HEC6_FUSRE|nr:uncharacterized protein BKA55DRAFT_314838 [Fusarium redolens]KAH7255383.1 hypothetical protein BKA55DRAFT_314838 [Fusarium redolens]